MNGRKESQGSCTPGWGEHWTPAHIAAYLRGELGERDRERLESHIAGCDGCIRLYMDAVEQWDSPAGGTADGREPLPDMDELSGRVVRLLTREQESAVRKKSGRRSWLRHPAASYGAAAAITLLLLGTGTFAGLTDKLAHLDQLAAAGPNGQDTRPIHTEPWSEQMMDRTVSWLDKLASERFK